MGSFVETCDDEALLALCRASDQAGYRELIKRHLGMVRRLALNIVGDQQDAEDVAQEVFFSLWRSTHGWQDGEAKFSTWLHRVAINRAIDFRRRRKAEPMEDRALFALADRAAPATTAQDREVARREMGARLQDLIEALPAAQAQALRLFYFEDQDVAAIMATTGASEQSVRSLLKRGREALRIKVQRQKKLWHGYDDLQDEPGDAGR